METSIMDDMCLELWKSDLLLPSVDAKCLQFMLCARICAAPIQMQASFAPWNSPTGNYPVFRIRNPDGSTKETITDFKQFRQFLQREVPKCAIDGHLDNEQLGILSAYESSIELNLLPAYLYTLWVDEYNASSLTGSWFGQQMLFPYSLYYVHKQKSQAKGFIRDLFGSLMSEKSVEILVTKKALQCINQLSAKLGDKKYFFGNKPSSLDALVFGYLAPLLRLPLPNDTLQQHIKNCPNLVRFVESISNIYLPLSQAELTQQVQSIEVWRRRKENFSHEFKRKQNRNTEKEMAENEDIYPLRDKIIFGLTALVLTFAVATHLGFVEVDLTSSTTVEKTND